MDIFSILLLIFVISGFFVFAGCYFDAMWLPTKKSDYDRIAKLSRLKQGMNFYDLGSGSSSLLFYLSKKYDINCIGIEVAPFWYLYSKIKSLFYKNVNIKYGNFYKYDISSADVVYAYLLPRAFNKLKNKVIKELRSGGKLILSSWPFEDMEVFDADKKDDSAPYYLYIKKP
ncbi:MAG: type 12 methyltransferase [Parcubacteria group bacterium Licking1014_1]|nr:MAG: type 12 methyltransferase [Parcubacteria group bacterium Licking1014_1]